MLKKFDAIVIGGGHAGIEATFALANNHFKVALITVNAQKLASMPCNPAIGGPAKGILTREIDALGGMQGIFSDQATIQIKELNQSKGPAVRALRAQIDKTKYSQIILKAVLKHPSITLIENTVHDLVVKEGQIEAVVLSNLEKISSNYVIITTGTYLNAKIYQGQKTFNSGPDGEPSSNHLGDALKRIGFMIQRLKTGTPPRILASSIDFNQVEEEVLEKISKRFSWRSKQYLKNQVHCYLTYTNAKTHQIIRDNLKKSSLYSGAIDGVGPRYCPSIEDKVVRFHDKERHQIFYEPENRDQKVIYLNGLSTSLPPEIQTQIVKTLPGCANAKILKYGYAIEYDALDPLELNPSLESKKVQGLFFAGQINGTSGYEEAASQGLIAGINVSQTLKKLKRLILKRDQAYIGVLIDDLVTKGTNEPYRMLTSRAEYRLILRHDNADFRLSQIGFEVGLIPQKQHLKVVKKYQSIAQELERLKKTYLSINDPLAKKYNLTRSISYLQLLNRQGVILKDVSNHPYIEDVWIQVRLEGYIKKQTKIAKNFNRYEKIKIPIQINYHQISNLASEAKQKLSQIQPQTIAQAMRIPGVNLVDIQMLLFYLETKNQKII